MKKILLALTMLFIAAPALAQSDAELDAFIEILRSDVRGEKVALITEHMAFTNAEAEAFWPIYRKYEREVRKINNSRIELIKEYSQYYFDMSDDRARDLAKRSIDLQIKLGHVRKKYFRLFDHALETKTAVKFMQLDQQIALLVDLQIASELPFIK